MKIIILTALKEWMQTKYKAGAVVWREIAEELGMGVNQFYNQDNFSTPERMEKIISLINQKLFLQSNELENKFIQYWMTDFAPRLYQSLVQKAASAKDFIQTVTMVSNELAALFPGNKYLSNVDLEDVNSFTLRAVYSSEKSLVDIIGVLRGVSTMFKDTFNIKKINPHSIEITFDKK